MMEAPQTGKRGEQGSLQSLDLRRLIEDARKAIERADKMVRNRILEAIRAQRDK